jgi:hypothetical protein
MTENLASHLAQGSIVEWNLGSAVGWWFSQYLRAGLTQAGVAIESELRQAKWLPPGYH